MAYRVGVVALCVAVALSCGGGGGGGDGGGSPEPDPGYPASVARVELPVSGEDRAFVGIEGTDGTTFWAYGVRDANGVPLYVDELMLTSGEKAKARFLFDERQRVVWLDLPDGTEIHVAYGVLDAEVTVVTAEGETEIVVVENPYPESPGSYVVDAEQVCEAVVGIPGETQYSGIVEVCVADVPPRVALTTTDPWSGKTSQSNSKLLPANVEHTEYLYFLHTPLTDDFDHWQDLCICTKLVTSGLIATGVLVPVFSVASTISDFFRNLVQSTRSGSTVDGAKSTLELVMELLESGSFAALKEGAEWLYHGDLPCSRGRFDALQRMYGEPVQIFALDHGRRQSGTFIPGGDFSDLPTFDFTEDCCLGVETLRATLKPGIPYEGQSVVVEATIEPVVPGCVLRFEVYDPLLSIHYIPVDHAGKAYYKVLANPDYPFDHRSVVIFTNAGHRLAVPWTPQEWP